MNFRGPIGDDRASPSGFAGRSAFRPPSPGMRMCMRAPARGVA